MTGSTDKVPFFRPSISDDEVAAVTDCLRSGWLTTGPNAAAFEAEFAAYLGLDTEQQLEGLEAISVNSATAAMHLGLEAMGIGPGDEVILPTLTFTATAEVVRYLGAQPVFADIDPHTLCLDPMTAEQLITQKTRAIMPVHFAGRACDMTGFADLAQRHGVSILDDAAHALPTRHKGAMIGTVGATATAFSFYANKTMTTGEGGMLVTSDPTLADRARKMRLHGIDRDVFQRFTKVGAGWAYDIVAAGFKYNLTDMAAALGRVQLTRCNAFHEARSTRAARYDEAFADLPVLLPPRPGPGDSHSWHLYILQLRDDAPLDRDSFIAALNEAGIGTSVHYRPLHQMTYWAPMAAGPYPAADRYFERCVSIPHFMAMTDAEQHRVIDVVRSALGGAT